MKKGLSLLHTMYYPFLDDLQLFEYASILCDKISCGGEILIVQKLEFLNVRHLFNAYV